MRTWFLILLTSLSVVSCEPKGKHDEHSHGHHHGPNGGEIAELGDHAAHLEVKHDGSEGKMTVWILDGDLKPLAPDAAPVLNVKAEGGPQQLTSTATEESHRFELSGEPLKGSVDGRFRIQVGGQEYSPDIPHHEH